MTPLPPLAPCARNGSARSTFIQYCQAESLIVPCVGTLGFNAVRRTWLQTIHSGAIRLRSFNLQIYESERLNRPRLWAAGGRLQSRSQRDCRSSRCNCSECKMATVTASRTGTAAVGPRARNLPPPLPQHVLHAWFEKKGAQMRRVTTP